MSINCGKDGDGGGDHQKHCQIEMGKLLCPKELTTTGQSGTDTAITSTNHQVS